jgi:hypothetical protein
MQCPLVVGRANLESRLGPAVAIELERAMIAGPTTTARYPDCRAAARQIAHRSGNPRRIGAERQSAGFLDSLACFRAPIGLVVAVRTVRTSAPRSTAMSPATAPDVARNCAA